MRARRPRSQGRQRAGSPVRWERRHPAGFIGHGGSRRQGGFLKPRRFAETGYRVRYADPMRARRPRSQGRRRAGSPVRWERRHPAGFIGHGGSGRQGEFLKPRRFAETGYRVRVAAVPGEAASREPGTLGAPASCRFCRPRRIRKARRVSEATALCRDRLSGPRSGPDAGGTPAVPGEASPNGCYPAPPRGLEKTGS